MNPPVPDAGAGGDGFFRQLLVDDVLYIHHIFPGFLWSVPGFILTEDVQQGLRALSRRTGLSQSDLIRRAIDSLLAGEGDLDRTSLLRQARGLWADRDDLPDFSALRRELDRTEADAVRCRPGSLWTRMS